MPTQNNASPIRLGILALPLSGLLVLVGALFGFSNVPEPSDDPVTAARGVTNTGILVANFAGTILATTLLIFGVIALYAYLANVRGRSWALGGMVFSIVGIGLELPAFGVDIYTFPVLGRMYLNGQLSAFVEISKALLTNPVEDISFVLGSLLFLSVGFVLFGVAVWRSGILPKWAAVALAPSAFLITAPPELWVVEVVGALLLIVGGGWIALNILRGPSAREEGLQAQPQVQ